MQRLTIQYAAPADPEAFDRHYRDVHVPLAAAVPGLRRFTVSHPRGLGAAPHIHLVAELWFEDAETLRSALRSPEMAATAADAATFDAAGRRCSRVRSRTCRSPEAGTADGATARRASVVGNAP